MYSPFLAKHQQIRHSPPRFHISIPTFHTNHRISRGHPALVSGRILRSFCGFDPVAAGRLVWLASGTTMDASWLWIFLVSSRPSHPEKFNDALCIRQTMGHPQIPVVFWNYWKNMLLLLDDDLGLWTKYHRGTWQHPKCWFHVLPRW